LRSVVRLPFAADLSPDEMCDCRGMHQVWSAMEKNQRPDRTTVVVEGRLLDGLPFSFPRIRRVIRDELSKST
jgi:hypothetical protein